MTGRQSALLPARKMSQANRTQNKTGSNRLSRAEETGTSGTDQKWNASQVIFPKS
jgi:hypothetical protein